jgi:hypothetical protein
MPADAYRPTREMTPWRARARNHSFRLRKSYVGRPVYLPSFASDRTGVCLPALFTSARVGASVRFLCTYFSHILFSLFHVCFSFLFSFSFFSYAYVSYMLLFFSQYLYYFFKKNHIVFFIYIIFSCFCFLT